MNEAARIAAFIIAIPLRLVAWLPRRLNGLVHSRVPIVSLVALLIWIAPSHLYAQTDCLSCHADKTMQDAAGHSIAVDGNTFSASIHGSMKCNDCHADIKDYPHPDHIHRYSARRVIRKKLQGWWGACMRMVKNTPAPVAMETRTRFFPRLIHDPLFIR